MLKSSFQKPLLTKKKILKFLYWCRRIHKDYAKHPRWCRGNAGSVKHHQYCVERYTEVINFIKEITNEQD
jgi:hypothetical protein